MLTHELAGAKAFSLMSQAEIYPFALAEPPEIELWPYRPRTIGLLRRYARASVEIGRLPSLLGREFFRASVTCYSMKNFEDIVIFVTDVERSIEQLSAFEKTLLAMNVLEEYSIPEVARLLHCPQRSIERQVQSAVDNLSRIFLKCGLLNNLHN